MLPDLLRGAGLTLCAMLLTACASEANMDADMNLFDTAAMDAVLSGAVERKETLGVTAMVFDEGKVVYENSFGIVNIKTGQEAAPDTVYRIYSMTKPITSAVIMSLVEEGKIALDDPASKYIPQLAKMQVASLGEDGQPKFSPQTTPMTVEDLMLHRAGMGYGIYGPINPVEAVWEKAGLFNPDEGLSIKMDKLAALPLVVQPGSSWYYSYSIDVLGRIAEVVEGERLSDIMQARIFEPLGMTETGFTVRADQVARFANNYTLHSNGEFVLQDEAATSRYLTDAAFQSGGGGLVSTLEDYAKFGQTMLEGGQLNGKRILEEATVEQMMTNHLRPTDAYLFPWDLAGLVRFGYGGKVVVGDAPELGYSKGQWGWGGMAKTDFYVDKPNNAFAIIMLQQFQAEDPAVHDAFRAQVLRSVAD